MSDIENHQRMVNELAERVANLEALSENPEVTESLQDVQNRYDRVRTRCRVSKPAPSTVYVFLTILLNKHDYVPLSIPTQCSLSMDGLMWLCHKVFLPFSSTTAIKQLMQVVSLGFSFILIPAVKL